MALRKAVVRLYGNFLALLDYGERDALTGLFNRKTFTDCFMRATLQRPAGAQQPQIYLAALDLDHFKQVNDTFGHLIGDEVLLLTARLMRSVLRQDDGLFRFGQPSTRTAGTRSGTSIPSSSTPWANCAKSGP